MGGRARFVVGILAIAAVVTWLVLRDDSTKPAPEPDNPTDSARPSNTFAPQAPSLPPVSGDTRPPELPEAVPPAPTANERFEEEPRDEAWARKTEAELVQRWKKIRGGTLESHECRQSQCRLTVVGSEQDVGTSVADLEGPRGLHGYAQSVLLTSPEQKPDGSIALRIFVLFDR